MHSHFLHMHENGRRLRTRQYRTDGDGNEVMVHMADVEYYSFPQAGGHVTLANDSVTIQVQGFGGRGRALFGGRLSFRDESPPICHSRRLPHSIAVAQPMLMRIL